MRKTLIMGLLLLSLMTGTGCVRVALECEASIPPPQRFYAGTRFLPKLPMVVGLMASGTHHHKSSLLEATGFALFSLIAITDIPLEFALDTLLLPIDTLFYVCYKASPPLDKYLYDNNLPGMKAMLEKGADPNAVTPWFMEKRPLLYTVYRQGKEDFFELLLEHGAKVPFEMLMNNDLSKDNTAMVPMLRKAFRNGCPKELLENKEAKYLVPSWIKRHLVFFFIASPNDNALADALTILMDAGFPPHEWQQGEGGNPDKKTPLDVVMENEAMETAAKDRLIASMRAHGAKTYCETHNLKPSVKLLKTDGLTISPIFQPVVDILKESNKADLFLLADSYPGVDGPVLVIDSPRAELFCKVEPDFRRNIHFRRRISTTEWSDPPEVLDVPAMYRIVLTPPGRRLPSRRPQGMPTERGFWEAWYTLPTCEMYIEHAMHCGEYPDRDLLKICLLSVDHNDKRELLRRLIFAQSEVEPSIMEHLRWPAATKYGDKSILDRLQWDNANNREAFEMSKFEQKWLADATKALAEIGVTAEWRKAYGLDIYTTYAFSTHRDLGKTKAKMLPLAPYPDEIVVVLKSSFPKELANVHAEHSGADYWNVNHGQFTFPINSKHIKGRASRHIFVFYGDSVPPERVEQIIKAIQTSFK